MVPDLHFIFQRKADLLAAWHRKDLLKKVQQIPDWEMRELHRMTTLRGMSDEEARLLVAQKKAERNMRDELREKRLQREAIRSETPEERAAWLEEVKASGEDAVRKAKERQTRIEEGERIVAEGLLLNMKPWNEDNE